MLTLYGIKTCDTCRKAIKALEAAGKTLTVVDLRADAELAALVPGWLNAVGVDALLNKKSTTWRGLSDADKALADGDGVADLLTANPTLIKRPVITDGESVRVGWTKGVQTALVV